MNEARKAAIYLLGKIRRETLKEIGERFRIENNGSLGSTIERMDKRMAEDRKTARRIQ